jgi:hypothetical protein
MIKRTSKIAASVMAALFSVPASAHHAFSSEFDLKKPIHLTGVVTEVEFVNPHAWIHVAVKGENGKTDEWMIESGSPNRLSGRGITKLTLPVGTQVVSTGMRPRTGPSKAAVRNSHCLMAASCLFPGPAPNPENGRNSRLALFFAGHPTQPSLRNISTTSEVYK